MRVILKSGLLAVTVEGDDPADLAAFATWRERNLGHAFVFESQSERGGSFHDLGLREDACREPINIVYDMREAQWRPVANLALTPFAMRGRPYASVEGFWQGLKFDDDADRARVGGLWGKPAKSAGFQARARATFEFEGEILATGGPAHRALMLEACRAKFSQNLEAREALLATGSRPLIHRVRRDSETIPGALMADIWMRIRRSLQAAEADDPAARRA